MFRQLVNKALRFTNVTSEQISSFSSSSIKRRRYDLNNVQITGNVGIQPSLKEKGYVSFRMAVHNTYKDKSVDENVTKTVWLNVIVSRPGLKDVVMKYINKGDTLYISGNLGSSHIQEPESQRSYDMIYLVANDITTIRSQGRNNQNTYEEEEEEVMFTEEAYENK